VKDQAGLSKRKDFALRQIDLAGREKNGGVPRAGAIEHEAQDRDESGERDCEHRRQGFPNGASSHFSSIDERKKRPAPKGSGAGPIGLRT
jgi:hypothetical protein